MNYAIAIAIIVSLEIGTSIKIENVMIVIENIKIGHQMKTQLDISEDTAKSIAKQIIKEIENAE